MLVPLRPLLLLLGMRNPLPSFSAEEAQTTEEVAARNFHILPPNTLHDYEVGGINLSFLACQMGILIVPASSGTWKIKRVPSM